MKIAWIFALGFFVAAVISCQCLRPPSGRSAVQINEHTILIPGTSISGTDQEALNRVFRKYDNSLYRIAFYENGGPKKQIGEMDEMQVAEITKDYARKATASGLSSWIFQIGRRTHITLHPSATTHVTTGQTTHVTMSESTHVTRHQFASIDDESDALVKEVTPILEKYSK
ncbi:MAG: hypothetical protein ACR2G0_10330 [Chthoniobacterales bacterium]